MTVQVWYTKRNILDFGGDDTTILVNAANSKLAAGGGVCGAIHKAAGPLLAQECRDIIKRRRKPVRTGTCVLSHGFELSQFIIHAVGPIYDNYDMNDACKLLSKTYTSVLQTCKSLKAYKEMTVVIPAISTGIYGFPVHPATLIALNACWFFQINNPQLHMNIILSAFTPELQHKFEELEVALHPDERT